MLSDKTDKEDECLADYITMDFYLIYYTNAMTYTCTKEIYI